MLIDFTVSNWKSFSQETSFNLIASRERQYGDTLSSIDGFRSLKVVPAAAMYGGNASGKTCFFEALAFLKRFVVEGFGVGETIPVEPFRLDEDQRIEPTLFDITFLVRGKVYRLEVVVRRDGVISEELSILKDKSATIQVYSRQNGYIEFNDSFFSTPERTQFVADGTLENRLFLTNAVMQNIAELSDPYHWFRDCLTLVGIASRLESFDLYYTDRNFVQYASERLAEFDTGIEEVVGEEVDINSLPLPPVIIQQIQSQVSAAENTTAMITTEIPGDYAAEVYLLSFDGGSTRAQRLRTRHRDASGKLVTFSLQMESSGSRRLLNLMPMLFDLFGGVPGSERVYVVDELDRSFHSMLTAKLVELFLETTGRNSRRQLLFTTHDLLLMNQKLLRRDEMFISERDGQGRSEIIRMNEFEGLRFDKDLLRSYLDGRFGGVPMFASSAFIGE